MRRPRYVFTTIQSQFLTFISFFILYCTSLTTNLISRIRFIILLILFFPFTFFFRSFEFNSIRFLNQLFFLYLLLNTTFLYSYTCVRYWSTWRWPLFYRFWKWDRYRKRKKQGSTWNLFKSIWFNRRQYLRIIFCGSSSGSI